MSGEELRALADRWDGLAVEQDELAQANAEHPITAAFLAGKAASYGIAARQLRAALDPQ